MKARYKIAVPATATAAFSLYLFMVANGYSPYMEGISMTYHADIDPHTIILTEADLEPVTTISETDLAEAPKIRGMLEVGLKLEEELPLRDDGFAVLDWGLNSYWVSLRYDENVGVKIGMPQHELQRHEEWLQENVPGNLMEYKGRYFSFSSWVA